MKLLYCFHVRSDNFKVSMSLNIDNKEKKYIIVGGKMKRFFVFVLMFVLTFVLLGIEVGAAEIDTALNGFTTVNGFEYISDKQTDQKYIVGSKYTYGYISLRTFYYKYYDAVNDNMYYLIMSKATIHGNGDDSGGFYSSKSLNIKYSLKQGVSTIQCYGPEPQSIGISVTEGFNVGGSVNSDNEMEFEIGYSHQTTLNYEAASAVVTQGTNSSTSRYIEFKVNFIGYAANNAEIAPYVGEYIFRSSAVFKIANYSQHLTAAHQDLSYVNVELKGEIFKNGFWGDYTDSETIIHSYYNSSNGRSLN